MKNLILLSLAFSFIFSGCVEKEQQIVFKDKFVCVEQQTIQRNEPTQIRVHNDDLKIALAYKESISSSFDFYEEQINRNNKLCKQIRDVGVLNE